MEEVALIQRRYVIRAVANIIHFSAPTRPIYFSLVFIFAPRLPCRENEGRRLLLAVISAPMSKSGRRSHYSSKCNIITTLHFPLVNQTDESEEHGSFLGKPSSTERCLILFAAEDRFSSGFGIVPNERTSDT